MTAGYFPPEGSGKYWCVQAKGNSNRVSNYNNNQISSASYALVTSKDDGILPQLNRLFPNMSGWGDVKLTELNDAENTINLSEIAAIGLKIIDATDVPKGKELLIFPEQTLSGIKTSDDSFYWSGPLKFLPNGSLSLDLVWAGVVQGNRSYFNSSDYDFLDRNLCTRVNSGGQNNFIGFRANFDKDTGKLTNIDTKMCDNAPGISDNTGWAKVDLVFYLKEVCTDIRQVVENDPTNPVYGAAVKASPLGFLSKPRTDRIWKDSKYFLGGDNPSPKLDLQYNQLNSPFGSFSQTKDPEINPLGTVLANSKTLSEKKTAWRKSGYWPIWFSDGGATPLNCAGENGGDCGGVALCEDGPKKGTVCNPTAALEANGCEENFPDGKCVGVPNYVYTGKIRGIEYTTNEKCVLGEPIPSSLILGTCKSSQYTVDGFCVNDADVEFSPQIKCNSSNTKNRCTAIIANGDQINCTLGQQIKKCDKSGLPSKENTVCSQDSDCSGVQPYACASQNNIRGLCVGGSNHNKYCAGNSDCPSRTYTETQGGKEVVENGVCVGSALDDGKTIPVQNSNLARGIERSFELFTSWYGTWGWYKPNAGGTDNKYTQYNNDDSRGWFSFDQSGAVKDYATAEDCKEYPGHSCNPKASIEPKPPKIFSVIEDKTAPSGYTMGPSNTFTINKSSSGPVPLKGKQVEVTLEFFAFADNDQMPLTRISVDWGDGTAVAPDVYSVKGWYKNRKARCNTPDFKVCGNGTFYNIPCLDDTDCASIGGGDKCRSAKDNPATTIIESKRLYFGNSSSACEEKPFVFKHIYECKAGAPGKTCSFIPKVQVLDNWGWCNSKDGKGRWNTSANNIEEKDKACFLGKIEPWTKFSGAIEVNP